MSFTCMRMKYHFHIKGWGLNFVLIKRPGELGNGLFGNTSVWQGCGYLSSLLGRKLQIVGIISGRACAGRVYYKLRQPGITTKDCTKGIKKAEEERWKERRATHSVAASLPELILLQLSCAGCLWSFKAWVSPRLLFFRDLSEFPLFLRLTFPSLLHPPLPPSSPDFKRIRPASNLDWAAMSVQKHM